MLAKLKLSLLAAALLASLPFAGAAAAGAPVTSGVVERGEGQQGFIYWSDGYLVMVGEAIDFCVNPSPPTGPGGTTVSPGNDSQLDFSRSEVPISVYEYPGVGGPEDPFGGFMFLGANCGAIFDGDPSTEPIEPIATGDVRLRAKFRVDTDGVTHSLNSLVGRVETASGDSAHVSTFAQVKFIADGPLIELKQLRVRFNS